MAWRPPSLQETTSLQCFLPATKRKKISRIFVFTQNGFYVLFIYLSFRTIICLFFCFILDCCCFYGNFFVIFNCFIAFAFCAHHRFHIFLFTLHYFVLHRFHIIVFALHYFVLHRFHIILFTLHYFVLHRF